MGRRWGRIRGRVAVVTGASSGIGRATVLALADRGARVVATARRSGALDDLAREAGGPVIAVSGDIRDPATAERVADRAVEAFGGLDLWVNDAAVTMFATLEEAPLDDVRAVLDTNVMGYLHGARSALRRFRELGGGTLVNVGSVVSVMAVPYVGAYTITKFAVRALSDVLRGEVAGDPIHVCTVLPASIDTPLFRQGANYLGRQAKPVDPMIPPERVARAIVGCARFPRRQVYVGWSGRAAVAAHAVAPGLVERLLARRLPDDHLTPWPAPPASGNLHEPRDSHATVSGGFRARGGADGSGGDGSARGHGSDHRRLRTRDHG